MPSRDDRKKAKNGSSGHPCRARRRRAGTCDGSRGVGGRRAVGVRVGDRRHRRRPPGRGPSRLRRLRRGGPRCGGRRDPRRERCEPVRRRGRRATQRHDRRCARAHRPQPAHEQAAAGRHPQGDGPRHRRAGGERARSPEGDEEAPRPAAARGRHRHSTRPDQGAGGEVRRQLPGSHRHPLRRCRHRLHRREARAALRRRPRALPGRQHAAGGDGRPAEPAGAGGPRDHHRLPHPAGHRQRRGRVRRDRQDLPREGRGRRERGARSDWTTKSRWPTSATPPKRRRSSSW